MVKNAFSPALADARGADEGATQPSWGRPLGLPPSASSARSFTGAPVASTIFAGDRVRTTENPVAPAILSPVFFSRPNRVFRGVPMALQARSNHQKPFDAPELSSWGSPSGLPPGFRPARSFPVTSGRFFNAAADLPLGAELYVNADTTVDLIAGIPANRMFNGAGE